MKRFALLALFVTGLPLNATTIQINEPTGTVEVYSQQGSQINGSTPSVDGSLYPNFMAMRFGTFLNGFIPTYANADHWFSNFVGVNGVLGVNALSGKLLGSINAYDGNMLLYPVTSNTGIGANYSAGITTGSQLYAIVWNSVYKPNGNGGNVFDPSASGLEAAIITNVDWRMVASSGIDTSTYIYSLTPPTTAIVGSFDAVNKGITLQSVSVPEPSALYLFAFALLGLFAIPRRGDR